MEQDIIQILNTKIEALAQRVDELESTLFDGLLNPMNEFVEQKEHDNNVAAFGEAHPEIADLKDNYAAIYDDADITTDIYDSFKESGYDDENEYVAKAVEVITQAIEEAKRKLGVNIEAEPTEEGVEIKVEPEAEAPKDEQAEVAAFEKELERYL